MNTNKLEKIPASIGYEMVRITEAAAIAAARFIGTGNKIEGDKAAVDAMRSVLNQIPFQGQVIIGEGEKDEAPMLFNGELCGTGHGVSVDIAVDPVEGTTLMANGRPNSITVIGFSEKGSMWNPGNSFYMNKLVVEKCAKDVIDIRLSATDNLQRIAKALDKPVNELTVYVLQKDRHIALIKEIRSIGAKVSLHTDGDVLGALLAAMPGTQIDVLMGIGGTPEGVITACAVKALGGGMQGMRRPQKEFEKQALIADQVNIDEVLSLDMLVNSDNTFFAATGITSGELLKGVKVNKDGSIITNSLLIQSKTKSVRFLKTIFSSDS